MNTQETETSLSENRTATGVCSRMSQMFGSSDQTSKTDQTLRRANMSVLKAKVNSRRLPRRSVTKERRGNEVETLQSLKYNSCRFHL